MASRRSAAVLVALVALSLLAVATVGVAAQSGDAAGNVTQTTGDYDLSTLTDGGTIQAGAPDSVRFMGQYGSAALRYDPVGPLLSERKYLSPDTTLHTNTIKLRTVRLAPADELDRTLNVTVVAWERGTRVEEVGNGTAERPAAVNQTVYRQQVDLGRGYDNATIQIPPNYDRTRHVTMWIEEFTEARWTFEHRSVPSTQAVDIDTKGEAWSFVAQTALIPGLFGVLVGAFAGRETLKKTTSGPRWGLTIWAIITAVLLAAVLSTAYFQVAVVLNYFPWLLGGVLAVLGYGLALWFAGSPSKVGFYRVELFDARLGPSEHEVEVDELSPQDAGDAEPLADGGLLVNGDDENDDEGRDENNGPGSGLSEIKEVRYVDLVELPAMERPDGKIGVPESGLRPFLARLFADPATLDKSDLVTLVSVDEGELDEIVLVDPESDETVTHEHAHLERRWPVLHAMDEDADTVTKLGMTAAMLVVVAGVPAAGWSIGAQFGVPLLGGALATLVPLVSGHEAKDGEVDFEPANQHFQRAQATLIDLQREQADGKTAEDFRQQAWQERARTAQEAVELAAQHDRTLTEEMLSQRAGYDLIEPDEDGEGAETEAPDAGEESDDD